MVLTNSDLDAEEGRRRYCISHLRNSDMGEAVTNRLMEQLGENPGIIDAGVVKDAEESPRDSLPFEAVEAVRNGMITIESRVAVVELSNVMAARLRSLYVTHHPVYLLTPGYLADFSRAAFMLLYRYSYVDPGFRRQSYLGPQYFEAITDAFDRHIDLEGFAAAFNTTAPSYCSLFPDVESAFGSRGSFFDLTELSPTDRLVQVSPPRVGSITLRAVQQSIALLENSGKSVTRHIILFTPSAWADVNALIRGSGLLVWQNRTKRGDKIQYYDVAKNAPAHFPMPTVSVLSNVPTRLSGRATKILHSVFSS